MVLNLKYKKILIIILFIVISPLNILAISDVAIIHGYTYDNYFIKPVWGMTPEGTKEGGVNCVYDSIFSPADFPQSAGFYVGFVDGARGQTIICTLYHPMYEENTWFIYIPWSGEPEQNDRYLEPKCSDTYTIKVISDDFIKFYNNIQQAYDEANSRDVILLGSYYFNEDVHIDQDKEVEIHGGYDCTFKYVINKSVIRNISITNGALILQEVDVEGCLNF